MNDTMRGLMRLAWEWRWESLSIGEACRSQRAWELCISTLVDWSRDPAQLSEDGLDPPSKEAIDKVLAIARAMRDYGSPYPTRIVPDGEGGISFERSVEGTLITYGIAKDGSEELCVFVQCRLVFQSRLPSPTQIPLDTKEA